MSTCLANWRPIVLILLLGSMLALSSAVAQESQEDPNQGFDDWLQDWEDDQTEFEDTLKAEWEAWARADSLAFAAFAREVGGKWGEVTVSTKKDWVEYADDKESLTAVDFEKGEAVVAVLVEAPTEEIPEENTLDRAEAALARLEAAVQKLVADRGKTMDYPVAQEQPRPLSTEPVLTDQLADSAGRPVTPENAAQFAREIVAEQPIRRTAVKSEDGVARVKLEVAIPLVPKHLRVRAEKFLVPVRSFAKEYGLDTRMVMALIHTESYFNPKAKSHVPAYGLMQLVPRYGAKDAYQAVYNEDKLLSANYLYVPNQNVELGCAYLDIVLSRYLKKISNPESRLYCAIAAYNTGAGNVSRTFTGERKVGPAAEMINAMQPDEVLAKLKRDLPYQETRDYITRILDRMKYYEEWKD